MTKWPAPVVRLFLEQLTPDAVMAAADNPDDGLKKNQICEANFFNGIRAQQQGTKEEAVRLFRVAAAVCPKSFTEWYGANAELKASGENK